MNVPIEYIGIGTGQPYTILTDIPDIWVLAAYFGAFVIINSVLFIINFHKKI